LSYADRSLAKAGLPNVDSFFGHRQNGNGIDLVGGFRTGGATSVWPPDSWLR
jgi:hypothetical protein